MTYEIHENTYGHLKRLRWILSNLSQGESICEIGCGTGAMITIPLVQEGFSAIGVDTDEKSIRYGNQLFIAEGLPPALLTDQEFAASSEKFDVLIVSEVLEHLTEDQFPQMFEIIKSKLKSNGKLLITVPNGYGWFELESYFYFKKRLGKVLEKLKFNQRMDQIKNVLLRRNNWVNTRPSTLCHSPHLQSFTYKSIKSLLRKNEFTITGSTGSVMFTGPFSDILFSGLNPIMKLNNLLGSLCPILASGFFVSCRYSPKQND